jgi:hypothetical protein
MDALYPLPRFDSKGVQSTSGLLRPETRDLEKRKRRRAIESVPLCNRGWNRQGRCTALQLAA